MADRRRVWVVQKEIGGTWAPIAIFSTRKAARDGMFCIRLRICSIAGGMRCVKYVPTEHIKSTDRILWIVEINYDGRTSIPLELGAICYREALEILNKKYATSSELHRLAPYIMEVKC